MILTWSLTFTKSSYPLFHTKIKRENWKSWREESFLLLPLSHFHSPLLRNELEKEKREKSFLFPQLLLQRTKLNLITFDSSTFQTTIFGLINTTHSTTTFKASPNLHTSPTKSSSSNHNRYVPSPSVVQHQTIIHNHRHHISWPLSLSLSLSLFPTFDPNQLHFKQKSTKTSLHRNNQTP